MSQVRLNFLMVLHVHKEFTDHLDLIETANQFVSNKSADHRLTIFGTIFGKFTERDTVGVTVCPTCGKVSSCSTVPVINRHLAVIAANDSFVLSFFNS